MGINDWSIWLNSNETRTAIKILNNFAEELREAITDGSHLQEKDGNKIALDYTYSMGQLAGVREVLEIISDIKEAEEQL